MIRYVYGLDTESIDTALRNYLGAKYLGLEISGFSITVFLSEDLTAQEKQTIKERIEDLNFRAIKRIEE